MVMVFWGFCCGDGVLVVYYGDRTDDVGNKVYC